MTTPTLPEDLRARILARAASTPAPSRAQTRMRVALLVGAGLVWMALLALVHGRRADWSTAPGWMVWVPFLDASLAAAVVTGLVVSRGRTMLGAPVGGLLAAMILAPVVTGVVAVSCVLGALGGSAWLSGALELRTSMACDVFSLVLAVPLLGLLVLALRGRTLPAPALVGALVGVCAGTWSHAALSWLCPWNDPVHLLVGHVLPSVPLALLGAWAMSAASRRQHELPQRSR